MRIKGYLLFIYISNVFSQSPGGVNANLELWLKADVGVTGGASVSQWNDQSSNGYHATSLGTLQPNSIIETINFNQTISFDGTTDSMKGPSGNTALNSDETTFFTVYRRLNQGGYKSPFVNRTDAGGDTRGFVFYINSAQNKEFWTGKADGGWDILSNGSTSNIPEIISFSTTSGVGSAIKKMYVNSLNVSSTNTGIHNKQSVLFTPYRVGSGSVSASGSPAFFFRGDISEQIVYSNVLVANDQLKVESYLALKYGITLNQTSPTDYLASNGTTLMWDSGTTDASIYNNDIFGVGRDDSSGLGQLKSKSNNLDGVITILAEGESTGDNNDIADYNFTDIANLEFLTIGNNNGSATWIPTVPPVNFHILGRKWSVQEIGEVGTLQIDFNVANSFFDIPDILFGYYYYMIIDSNNDGNYNDETPIGLIDIGNNVWRAEGIDLENGNEFTLATVPSNVMRHGKHFHNKTKKSMKF